MCHGPGVVITSLFLAFIYSESCIKYSRAWLLSLDRTYLGSIHAPVSTGGGAVASCMACHYTHTRICLSCGLTVNVCVVSTLATRSKATMNPQAPVEGQPPPPATSRRRSPGPGSLRRKMQGVCGGGGGILECPALGLSLGPDLRAVRSRSSPASGYVLGMESA